MKVSLPHHVKAYPLAKGSIPSIGFGTWRSKPNEVKQAVKVALSTGYRHVDCAYIYMNEPEVGAALEESGIPRDQLFITSKLWNSFHRPEHVKLGIQETLKNLKTPYLDLYLMHWPVAFKFEGSGLPPNQPKDDKGQIVVDYELTEDPLPTWRAMEKLVEEGLGESFLASLCAKLILAVYEVRNIGVSNFNVRRLTKLMQGAKIKPAVNQVELNFGNPQPELLKWSKDNGIVLEAYSPLGSQGAPQLSEPAVKELAQKHNCSPAQILISWQLARGVVVLPKSVTPERIEQNFKIVNLSKEDVDALEIAASAKPPQRTVKPSWGSVDIFEDGDGKSKL